MDRQAPLGLWEWCDEREALGGHGDPTLHITSEIE